MLSNAYINFFLVHFQGRLLRDVLRGFEATTWRRWRQILYSSSQCFSISSPEFLRLFVSGWSPGCDQPLTKSWRNSGLEIECFWELFDRNNLGAHWASEICNRAMRLRFIDFAPLCPPLWGHGSWLFSLQLSFLALKLGLQALLKGEFYIPFMFDCLW